MKQNTRKTFGFFWRHVKRYKLLAVMMYVFLTGAVVLQMLWPIYLGRLFDVVAMEGDKAGLVPEALYALFLIFMVGLAEWAFWRAHFQFSNRLIPKAWANITDECFEYIHKHSYRFFTNNFSGSLVKRVARMGRAFSSIMRKFQMHLYPMVLQITIAVVVLSYMHPVLGGALFVWVIIFSISNYWLSMYKFRHDVIRAKADSAVMATLSDSITNNSNIKLFAAFDFENQYFQKKSEDWYRKNLKSWFLSEYIDAGQFLLMLILEALLLYVAIKLWGQGMLTTGAFAVIQLYLFRLFETLWNFSHSIRDVYEGLADAEEMTEILNETPEVMDIKGAGELLAKFGKLEFSGVNFSYGDGEEVIEDLEFRVKSGEKVALIGPSGGGKSTIVKLILRLFDIQSGKIEIDGQDIEGVTQDSLRSAVSLVPQDPILFHRTLMENIRYGRREAADEEVMAAARMAHCDEFIRKFPQGYETLVGERGIKLSGGQRQRVAIARAILSNARILILDEATSSLDSESETLIQDALEKLMKNRTTLIIAHRLSTIMKADRIFVLEGGKIVEEGQHADLVQKKGLYKRLWDLQVGGYL